MDPANLPRKRAKLNDGSPSKPDAAVVRLQRATFLSSLSRSISPPHFDANAETIDIIDQTASDDSSQRNRLDLRDVHRLGEGASKAAVSNEQMLAPGLLSELYGNGLTSANQSIDKTSSIPSPFRLTRIKDLPANANVDTVGIKDVLGDPLIKEAWIFNYCFNIDWLMQHFDPDVRDLVEIKIIHGSWRREDGTKIHIDNACRRYSNVTSIPAYLPDAFGTHHSKMFILIRHDDTAQVIIHTANMLACDWDNATQAAWRSPLLPVLSNNAEAQPGPLGSGSRFKHDLVAYLKAYGNKLSGLTKQLKLYDFEAVKGALIASVPSKVIPNTTHNSTTLWGHPALSHALSTVVPTKKTSSTIVCQVSSIATITKAWLTDTLFKALSPTTPAKVSIIFPTAEEVRVSLNGYGGGASIHLKAQTAAHQKQIDFLHPHLCHWDASRTPNMGAHRGRAAPHIKTYIRFASTPTPKIEWGLLTSANLSMQAWGSVLKTPSKKERDEDGLREPFVHIQSYELGVLVWPALFAEDAVMVPVFGKDMPDSDHAPGTTVGLRIPYDLPLSPYRKGEQPWSPGSRHDEHDSHGNTWPM